MAKYLSAGQSAFGTGNTELSETITTTGAGGVTGTTVVAGGAAQATGDSSPSDMATATGTSTAAAATGTAAYTGDILQSAVLNGTNYFRAQHQAGSLTWNTTLAQYATSYAEKCLWQESNGPYGENLAEGYASPTLSIDAWANEEKHYDYAKPKFSESTGHYTQLVWKNTRSVGCGAVNCDSSATNGVIGWFLVCEYSPRGNVDGQFEQEVGKSGEGKDGEPGFGAGSRSSGNARLLAALAAAYVFLAICV